MMAALNVTDLTVTTRDGDVLVDGASWSIAPGERVGIIGESGSGKSLTALAILGLLPDGLRASGAVEFDGVNLLTASSASLRSVRGARIAMVFQEPLTALDPLMRLGKQIAGPLRLHRGLSKSEAAAEALRLAGLVQLPEPERILRSFPWEISGGQRQRVALAMALACSPDVLIADEPTTALDVTVQAQILELLDDVAAASGASLVFISHDLPVVASLTRNLVVMRAGQVVERTTVDRALAGADHPYTRELIAAARASTLSTVPGGAS